MGIEIAFGNLLDRHIRHRITIHVFLLIYCLQLTLKQSKHRIHQPFAVNFRPLRDVLRRKRIEIKRIVVRGASIELGAAIAGDQPIKLIRDHILCRTHAQVINHFLQLRTLFRIFRFSQNIIFISDIIQQDLLRLVISRTNLVRSLKHHVLKIMSDAGIGAIFGTCLDHHRPKDFGLAMILIEPNGQLIA